MKPTIWLMALLCPLLSMCQSITIRGNVINEEGSPVPAATITIKGTNKSTIADASGRFTIPATSARDSITVSAIGYQTITEPNNERGLITITLKRRYTLLDETIIMAYGTTSKRLNTGNIAKISAAEITTQPVSNPLAALHGRVPGLLITQGSGAPGTAVKIEIRGRTSLDPSIAGNDPLFIIDGVPFAPGNDISSQLRSSANNPRQSSQGGLSPFALINPSDIESIEVLKDADATSIYGSRGANGVILITTKKGKPGRTAITANLYSGFSRITSPVPMMNTQQYIQMRKEAFANDGITPTTSNAPDLMVWDNNRYTDFQSMFIGGTANTSDIQLSLSGGTASTRFLIGGAYHKETTVYPGNLSDNRGSFHFNLTHANASKKFTVTVSALYSAGKNNTIKTDLTTFINLPPNFPSLYDSVGNLKWTEGGISFVNPLAELIRKYNAKNDNLNAGLQLAYRILPTLFIKANTGYNLFQTNESSLHPRASLDPQSASLAFATWANSQSKSWLIEPQLEYIPQWNKTKFSVMLGATWQSVASNSSVINAENYTSDLLLTSIAAAPLVYGSNSARLYRYSALFARVSINHNSKYLLNLSARRDASSRFGPGHRMGNFGAIGASWIFSKESFLQKTNRFLSFGKLRSSYGITGNDQVGDYRFLDSWQNASLTYQGTVGLQPTRLFNPDYSWELNRKFELALELGFLNDRIYLSSAYFINRSGNRLINYTLPVQTGFTSVLQNWDALVQNKGWELSITSQNISKEKITWSTTFNFTLPKNKLVSFPGLALSSYRNTYTEGYSLSLINAYRYLGVNPQTGIYSFADLDTSGTFTTKDYVIQGRTDPVYYGGLSNILTYKNWQLTVFLEFRKQTGSNYLATQSNAIPGYGLANQPLYILNHWQKPGDNAQTQRYTTTAGTPAYTAAVSTLSASGAVYSDASYIRLKNISCSYNLPQQCLAKMKMQGCRFYLMAQNIATFTNYIGADPENQNLYVLPPLRTITAGIQITL